MARSFKVYQGEDETPVYDLTDSTSFVHVIWEEIEAGGRAFRGASTSNSIPARDERAETGSGSDLPVGLTMTSLSRGSRWEWLDGPDGSEVRMAAGRIGTKDYSRGRQKADRAREVTIQAADRNEELKDIIVDDWVRGSETDVARVNALITDYLSGTPRTTTVIANTYVASGNTVTMPAKTYDGTNPHEVLSEIASYANKNFFVTIDDELWYDTDDSLTYPAGLRISDRLDELDYTCSANEPQYIEGYAGAHQNSQTWVYGLDVDGSSNSAFVVLSTEDPSESSSNPDPYSSVVWHPNNDLLITHNFTKVYGETATGFEAWVLLNPPAATDAGAYVRTNKQSLFSEAAAVYYITNVDTDNLYSSIVEATGTGTASSITPSTSSGDLVLNLAAQFQNNVDASLAVPTAGGGQTSIASDTENANVGQRDVSMGSGYQTSAGSSVTPTWTFNGSRPWRAIAMVIRGESAVDACTFPPKWDVGPASTEDGLELVSGLRLYYGTGGSYVYVNHAGTASEYWHAERSFYTNDPAIDDDTKATVLANAILTRMRFEDRNYNVSVGPLYEQHVPLLKPGQLVYIKARAIPDADDQFQPRRIAQLKWTTPVPGVFWAHMQLNRPIKEVPTGVGPKESSEKVAQHEDFGTHTASSITVTDAGAYFSGTDVEAILQEIGAGGFGSGPAAVTDHGSMGAAETFDFTDGSDHEGIQDANLTVTLTGATAGEAAFMTLVLTQDAGGGNTLVLPGSVVNASEIEAAWDVAADAVNVLTVFSYDGGTTWYAFLAGSGGTLDHGGLTGLADDDHTQYLNETRHDALDHAGLIGVGSEELLISDTPSTPLVFADLLQNEAQDDLLYGDI